jgi:transmembrane sensor
MEPKQLHEFLEKFSANRHTEEEHQAFLNWLYTQPANKVEEILEFYRQVAAGTSFAADPLLAQKIEARVDAAYMQDATEVKVIPLWRRYAKAGSFAACLVIACLTCVYFLNKSAKQTSSADMVAVNKEIFQGGNKAVLSLADGSHIILDSAKIGELANQGGASIYKSADGQVVIDASKIAGNANAVTYSTLSTPRGGQYVIKLPDGTSVWLNSSSSIKFPSAFINKERNVELTGEAYFEVAKDASKPFRVKTATQNVEVLGTHFNINAYTDEPDVVTTLLEGSVKVAPFAGSKTLILKPGQQARLNGDIKLYNVDADLYVDWKNGYFKFEQEDLHSIMRKISRWYDVDVSYKGNVTEEGFVGTVPRSKDITEVLNALKFTGLINYKIEGKHITVTP